MFNKRFEIDTACKDLGLNEDHIAPNSRDLHTHILQAQVNGN